MKTTLFKIMALFVLLYVGSLSNSSTANMTSFIQELHRPFTSFTSNPMCPFLTFSYRFNDGSIKPWVFQSLPIEYHLHESIPRQYRPFFHIAKNAWNRKFKKDVIKISDEIDRNPMNTKKNRSDQKNVIYLIDEEFFQELSTEFSRNRLEDIETFLPGTSRHTPLQATDESLPFLPIVETDMMIREEALSDLELYRYHLIDTLQKLGAQEPLSHLSVNDLRKMVFFHFENMTVEEYRSLALKSLERERNAMNDMSHSIRRVDPQKLDQDIEELKNMEPERVRFFKYDQIIRYLNVDIEMMKTQSSITLVNTAMHEMGHGLGLNHIPSNLDDSSSDGTGPLMEEEYI